MGVNPPYPPWDLKEEVMIMGIDEQLLTTSDVEQLLRVGERTLRDWRGKGIGPEWMLVGGNYRYSRLAIEMYLRSQIGLKLKQQ